MLRLAHQVLLTSVISCVCLQSHTLHAIVIRHDLADSDYLKLANDSKYDSVGRITFKGNDGNNYAGSGSLIAGDWILTAAHIVDDASSISFHIGGSVYDAASWLAHPKWDGSLSKGYDIGLIQLPSSLAITPADLYQGTNELGKLGTSVGYGMTGDGLTGATTYDAQKRAGENRIDVFFSTPGRGSRIFGSDFDNPDGSTDTMGSSQELPLESLISFGDSGGAVFIEENGNTLLAGVHSFGADYNSNGLWSDYDDYSGHTRVSSHYQWIMDTTGGSLDGGDDGGGGGGPPSGKGGGRPFALATPHQVPEPSSVALVALALLSLCLARPFVSAR